MLKKFLYNFFCAMGFFFSIALPNSLGKMIRTIRNYFYAGWIKGKLKAVGKGLLIEYPLHHIGLQHVIVGENFSCFKRLRLEAYDRHLDNTYTPILTIGNNVSINYDCHIGCINSITIGNNVLIASRVFITDHYHGDTTLASVKIPTFQRPVLSKAPVVIEDNVWLGEGVAVMPGVTIGANSIVGANAVVTKSFPANSVIGGVPAKLIKIIE